MPGKSPIRVVCMRFDHLGMGEEAVMRNGLSRPISTVSVPATGRILFALVRS